MSPQFLQTKTGRVAYKTVAGASPGIFFLSGFAGNMEGTKALFLLDYAQKTGQACTIFDYFGHGVSEGDFKDGTISVWLQNALDVLDQVTQGPVVVVGSSMGGWLMLRLAALRAQRVARMVGIAPAPGFTEDMWNFLFSDEQKDRLETHGMIQFSAGEDHYEISMDLIRDGRTHLLPEEQTYDCPLHLLHGTADVVVPWSKSVDILRKVKAPFKTLALVESGDHRLSRPEELAMLGRCIGKQPLLMDPTKL